jgi:phosphomannomutase
MKAFHAYDIRGIYPKEFSKDDVYKIGFFLPEILHADKVLVGRDARTSSPEIFEALCNGIMDQGADVYDAGLSTTPMIYWGTANYGFEASVMITASHNPKSYNGLKVSGKNALPMGYDTGLKEIEARLLNNSPVQKRITRGKLINKDINQVYLQFLETYISDFSALKIAIDCSNGMAGLLIRNLIKDQAVYINEDPDGTFPNHEPNPLDLKNIKQLQDLVVNQKSDIGIIFDGDADRVMFVDENGKFISPDLIIGLLAHYFLEEKGLKGNVLQDIRTSKSVAEYISKFDSQIHIWKVGRAFAALKLREINGIYGGELAGHYYFRDFYYSDSGILACLLVLRVVSGFKQKGMKLSEFITSISNSYNSGEINFKVDQKTDAMEAVRNIICSKEELTVFYSFDGYRIEFKDWWFNIRPSNTEPYLRLLVEATTRDLLEEKVLQISNIIKGFN